ncbi:MAG: type II/IV secretion system protein [Candidatus Pacebacteria bacterium]|nr:type II/IV secretion system protein [Candidatus Paceibacterota bacterium]
MGILDILARRNIVREEDIPVIRRKAGNSQEKLEVLLKEIGVSNKDILESKGEYFDIPVKEVNDDEISNEILEYIPEESALHYHFVSIGFSNGVLEVGITDPNNIEARDALTFISAKINLPYKIFLISEEDFKHVVGLYKGLSRDVTEAVSEFEGGKDSQGAKRKVHTKEPEQEKVKKIRKEEDEVEVRTIEDAPAKKIVSTILRYAAEGNTSDVHIEQMREVVRVRFRVDGILNTSLVLPRRVSDAVIGYIKVQANLRLEERRKPQDGRFSALIEDKKIDFRVSTFPTHYGEKVVMRILDQSKGIKKLDDLGLSKKNLSTIRRAIQRPFGLILISGPTGSGKTTTLYAMLNEIDKETQNVLSLEDPIEYNIEGINQSQVRPEINYTFANGLRTALRQDPDIIMVGEIRDKETAQLAIQAALTGHLVFSTIHTNNAIGTVPRLVDMGVDPYLISPTLILAIAQRLVRTLCPGAGKPMLVEGSIAMMIEKQFADLPEKFKKDIPLGKYVYGVSPTPECPTGLRGRVAAMEVFEIDKHIEELILKSPTEVDIWKAARENGMLTMKEDALIKAFERKVSFEEVNGL